jgi:CRISPR-associated protein Cmx8
MAQSKKFPNMERTAARKPKKLQVLELSYRLAEMPSSQHRAGLAGLVLMVRWLDRHPEKKKGVVEIVILDGGGATLRIDESGVAALLDEAYAATAGEVERRQPYKDPRTKQEKPPIRIEERSVTDKRGKTKTEYVYVYPAVIPRGAFQAAWDPSCNDGVNGIWVKLWRDTVWSIFRGVPATRKPYEVRATNTRPSDAAAAWSELVANRTTALPSTYFLGAQARTAENVAFRDRSRDLFLLHFSPFVTAINIPSRVDNEGKTTPEGFALMVPDIADLREFVEVFPDTLRSRPAEHRGYRPRGAIIDVAAEGAVELLRLLRGRLEVREGGRPTADLVRGIDVFHSEKQGNNVCILSVTRIEPNESMVSEYARIKGAYWNPTFRHHRLLNLLGERSWWCGFGALCATSSTKLTIENDYFRHDARQALTKTETTMSDTENTDHAPKSIEEQIYRMVRAYLSRRLSSKYELSWESAKQNADTKREYSSKREKLGREAFLAVRSRTGADFVEYFTSTICSVPQHLGEEAFLATSRALLEDPERVRTLTLLALSASS